MWVFPLRKHLKKLMPLANNKNMIRAVIIPLLYCGIKHPVCNFKSGSRPSVIIEFQRYLRKTVIGHTVDLWYCFSSLADRDLLFFFKRKLMVPFWTQYSWVGCGIWETRQCLQCACNSAHTLLHYSVITLTTVFCSETSEPERRFSAAQKETDGFFFFLLPGTRFYTMETTANRRN